MYSQFAAVLIFALLGIVFVFFNLMLGAFLRLKRPGGQKHTVYECGEPTIGSSWIRFNSRFYNVGLVYLLFDVEVVLLLPVVLVLRETKVLGTSWTALVALSIFLVLLVLGLAYEWVWGNLDWIRGGDKGESKVDIL